MPVERFAGVERLFGQGSVGTLAQKHVCVIGVGGVGSWAVEALARSGVAALTLIDLDHDAQSNINRQIQALGRTDGQAKVELKVIRGLAGQEPRGHIQTILCREAFQGAFRRKAPFLDRAQPQQKGAAHDS